MGSKEAWCGLCLPHQASGYGRGNSLVGGWLNLRNSSYRYHMIRAHGISPKTCLQYQEPLETRRRQQGVDGKVGEGSELKGLCHQCDKWITFGAIEPTNCSSSPLKVLATTNKHNVSSASGSPLKKVKFDTISSQEHAKKHQKHSLLPRKRTASESTQPTHYAGHEGSCSSSRVILATPRGKRPAPNKTAEGDEDAMESKPFFSVAEPGWTISSSGRIVKLRDAKWTNAI
ncbi:hypothetical protein BDZ90DRAFT_61915 [Jaminaea rosea]|uniref:Transcription regulator Rua1 C-terminal domain-containing protein n=1 Tax=Jaminaea rosea TaxID=1569628 RepID=A0A316UKJ6_9BASI|nr:hypothetical protein BDZ90DRAFT_61915 [Jaminaea rosea]PWN25759.1 hypothetical protein BDZ90DRAFT_61915 [Jaminaea rosea]